MPPSPKPRIRWIGRKRRTLGWTLITLGLLVAALWAASGWWWMEHDDQTWGGELRQGSASCWWWSDSARKYAPPWFDYYSPIPPSYVSLKRSVWWTGFGHLEDYGGGYAQDFFGFGYFRRFGGELCISLLLWPFPLLLWGVGIPLLRSGILARRRAMTGKCKSCGYDLAGLAPDAICPECGKGPNAGAATT